MGIICCYKDLLVKNLSIHNEACNLIREILESLSINDLKFRNIYKLIMEEDLEELNIIQQFAKKEIIDYKYFLKIAKNDFFVSNEKQNINYKFHHNIFSMLSFSVMDKNNPMINTNKLLTLLIPFSSESINEKIRYFVLLNKDYILGDKEEEINIINKKSNLKDIILEFLNYFIKTLTDSISNIIQEEPSRYNKIMYDLNILLALCTENKIDLFFEGFFQEDIDNLVDNFDENDLYAFFNKNFYMFDIIELRNNYFNLNK